MLWEGLNQYFGKYLPYNTFFCKEKKPPFPKVQIIFRYTNSRHVGNLNAIKGYSSWIVICHELYVYCWVWEICIFTPYCQLIYCLHDKSMIYCGYCMTWNYDQWKYPWEQMLAFKTLCLVMCTSGDFWQHFLFDKLTWEMQTLEGSFYNLRQ